MADWFPSREWLLAYRDQLNENNTYEAQSKGWGVDFEGDFIFEITGLPVEDTTVGELPSELATPFRDRLQSLSDDQIERLIDGATPEFTERMEATEADDERSRFITTVFETSIADVPTVVWSDLRAEIHDELDNLLDQLERYVHDDTVYAYLDLHDGECNAAEVLETPDETTSAFVLTAPYSKWTDLIDGADVIEAVMSQDMSLDGDITNIIIYPEAAQEMGDTAGRMETTFLF